MRITPKLYLAEDRTLAAIILSLSVFLCARTFADQIEMQNGDRYNGKVISMTNDIMVLQSDVLGTISFPRAKISRISLGTPAAVPAKPGPSTNSAANTIASLRKPGAASEAAAVKQQFLADADPAAKAKFDEMLGDLMSGKMTVSDLRVQAKSAADQLKALKKELGPEADSTLDGYLSILEGFLNEVPANESIATKAPAKTVNSKAERDE